LGAVAFPVAADEELTSFDRGGGVEGAEEGEGDGGGEGGLGGKVRSMC
jgi:hypothetical protein